MVIDQSLLGILGPLIRVLVNTKNRYTGVTTVVWRGLVLDRLDCHRRGLATVHILIWSRSFLDSQQSYPSRSEPPSFSTTA